MKWDNFCKVLQHWLALIRPLTITSHTVISWFVLHYLDPSLVLQMLSTCLHSLFSLPNLGHRLSFYSSIFQHFGSSATIIQRIVAEMGSMLINLHVYVIKWKINISAMMHWLILFESTSSGVRWPGFKSWLRYLTVSLSLDNLVSLCLSLLSCQIGLQYLLCWTSMCSIRCRSTVLYFSTLFCAPKGISNHLCPLASI